MFKRYVLILIFYMFFLSVNFGFCYDRQLSDRLLITGLRQLKEDKLEDAKTSFMKAKDADPTNDRVYKALGDYFFKMKNYDRAVENYDKAIDMGGDSRELNFKAALVHFDSGDYKKALVRLDRLKDDEVYQHDANFWFLMGKAYKNLGNSAKAEEYLKKAVGIDENLVDAHIMLGDIYLEQERYLKAKSEYQKALQSKNVDEDTKDLIQERLLKISNALNETNLWRLLIPVGVLAVILPAYVYLRKERMDNPEDEDEDENNEFYD